MGNGKKKNKRVVVSIQPAKEACSTSTRVSLWLIKVLQNISGGKTNWSRNRKSLDQFIDNIVSPYLWTFKFGTFKVVNVLSLNIRCEWTALTLHLLLLTVIHLYQLPPLLLPPVSSSSWLFTRCQPLCTICSTVPFKVMCCKIKNVFTFCVFFGIIVWKVLQTQHIV